MNPLIIPSAVGPDYRTYVQIFQRFQDEAIERRVGERIENDT